MPTLPAIVAPHLFIVATTIMMAQVTAINGNAHVSANRCGLSPTTAWHSQHWLPATGDRVRGVALLTHGLNQKPSAMNPVAVELNNMGLHVLRLDLRGHGNHADTTDPERARLEELGQITADDWLEEALCAFEAARARAEAEAVPLFFVGFSLGALVGVELLSSGPPEVHFDRMVLLAPAIRTRWYVHVVRALSWWPGLTLPSLAPAAERANAGTPIAAYEALFALEKRLQTPNARRIDIPTLVLVDEDDELVDPDAIRTLIAAHGLHHWVGASIKKGDGATAHYHHAITEPAHVGSDTWTAMTVRMAHHLLPD